MNPDKSSPLDLENGSLEQTVSKNAGQVATARLDPLGNPLVPTATSDPLDPLNWRPAKKYTIIFIVCLYYFLMTYLATSTIPSFPLLQEQFNATYNEVNWTFAIAALGLAVGPLLTAGLADTYGRRICMIVSTAVALVATGCTSIRNQNVGAYMAERFIQGVGAGPAANLGLSIIIDISWEHERGFRVGFWTISANLGTLLGGVCMRVLFGTPSKTLLTRIRNSRWICHFGEPVLDTLPRVYYFRGSPGSGNIFPP
jgi:MFS family permease